MKKKAAVIGYGGMGAGFHCKNLLTSDVCELAGIYDIDPAKRELAASRGVKVYNTREELLADPSIDMVTIATPNDVHEEIAVAAERAALIKKRCRNQSAPFKIHGVMLLLLVVHGNSNHIGEFCKIVNRRLIRNIAEAVGREDERHTGGSRGVAVPLGVADVNRIL